MLGQITLFSPDKSLPLRRRVMVEVVTTAQARHILEKYHYLHRARVGRQINYAVIIDDVIDGIITFAYPMISVPLNSIPSDEIIEFARMYLHSNIPHTATCAIGKVLKRVQADWLRLFPGSKTPRMVVSWSDTVYHKGTVYKASNFIFHKRSKGALHGNSATSKRGSRTKHGDYSHDKDCWIYPLKVTA